VLNRYIQWEELLRMHNVKVDAYTHTCTQHTTHKHVHNGTQPHTHKTHKQKQHKHIKKNKKKKKRKTREGRKIKKRKNSNWAKKGA